MHDVRQSASPQGPAALTRRDFLRGVGAGAAALAAASALPNVSHSLAVAAQTAAGTPTRTAEELLRELWGTLSDDQRRQVVKPWDHRSANALTRHRMVNAALDRRIGQVYTPAQRDLLLRVVRAFSRDEDGFDRICRRESPDRAWDNSQNFESVGADFFGSMEGNAQWAWVLSGHHITIRCDGNSDRDRAFGGPIYYGHTPDGYSQRNLWNYQTRAALAVYEALSEQQRMQAVVVGTPGEGDSSVRLRAQGEMIPGIACADLTRSQRTMVINVMHQVLSPFRQEETDRVMNIVNRTGGLQRIHLAFYREANETEQTRWHFWRLEGPGLVWNYRVLPHVHCYVNIAVPRNT